MPFNGSGSFSPPGADFPAVASTLIESAKFNAVINDIATGLSTCITTDGQSTVTANIPFGGNRLTGLGAASANGDALRYEQLFSTSALTLLGAMNWVKGANIASASTLNLTTATGNGVHVTGTTTITEVTLGSGMWRAVVFDGILTLTHDATNNNLPGAANITTAAGDRALYWADGTTTYCLAYIPASGAMPFIDTNPVVVGSADATKKVRFEVDGLTTATTRTLTVPDSSDTLVLLALAQVLTNKTLTSPVLNTGVSGTAIADAAATLTGSSTTTLLTPGGFAGNKSLGANSGYYKFPGGFMVQWVNNVTCNTGATTDVNWPVAFPTACVAASAMANAASIALGITTLNTSKAAVGNSSGSNVTPYVIGIGY